MADKSDLATWVFEAVRALGGSASLVGVAKHIWDNHEAQLRASGPLFYTWQYDMRWAADSLRRSGRFKPIAISGTGVWATNE